MHHLHFVQSTEPLEGGGLGRAALELSAALVALGYPSRLVTTCAKTTKRSDSVICYGRSGPTKAFYAPDLWREAEALVAEAQIVHGHGFYVATNWVLGREARRLNRPLVYHPHGMFEPWILQRSHNKKRLAHWLFENANFRHASLWRALTGKEADQIRGQGISCPIVVCPNGIDLLQFEKVPSMRAKARPTKSKRELLFLARLHPKKGLPLLVQAWASLPTSLRRDWQVVIAGPDELGHRGEVESLIRQHELAGEWAFTGSVAGEAKAELLARADGFVLPSHSEGFSVAILEAMACWLPVVATDACNFPDLQARGGGWTVPSGDVPSLARALRELMEGTSAEREQRGALARGLVEAEYTWPRIAAQMDNACCKLGRKL